MKDAKRIKEKGILLSVYYAQYANTLNQGRRIDRVIDQYSIKGERLESRLS